MTKGKQVVHHSEADIIPSSKNINGTAQPPSSFQVVLIDIKTAAFDKEIYCVKKLLSEAENINYVAISYRWGELNEIVVDTGVGYLASLTSFDLQDFYLLCAMMMVDDEMKSMDYVWIDAICVNQADYQQRKAAIHHMSIIYERANYILAVPDLHVAHLEKSMATNKECMALIREQRHYIYDLIHGNTSELYTHDDKFLDEIDVPKDKALRRLLTKYTDNFTDGLMELRSNHPYFDNIQALEHLFCCSRESSPTPSSVPLPPDSTSAPSTSGSLSSSSPSSVSDKLDEKRIMFGQYRYLYEPPTLYIQEDDIHDTDRELKSLHQCQQVHCPFKLSHFALRTPYSFEAPRDLQQMKKRNEWHHDIHIRNKNIRQSIHFLLDLIMDWTSRVWVISECHIAKRNNNLRYWFTQLTLQPKDAIPDEIRFFEFDINSSKLKRILDTAYVNQYQCHVESDPVYLHFHRQLFNQLNERSFVEMMLKSKASKHEDRFYSIFPLFPEYKSELENVSDNSNEEEKSLKERWNLTSILSIKLKLYELMKTKDKLDLLYLSCLGEEETHSLPTFATSTISWQSPLQFRYAHDNELIHLYKITLHQIKDQVGVLNYLHLQPPYYFKIDSLVTHCEENNTFRVDMLPYGILFQHGNKKRHELCKRLGFHPEDFVIDLVCIPSKPEIPPLYAAFTDRIGPGCRFLHLISSFKRNIWILGKQSHTPQNYFSEWRPHDISDYASGFNIY